MTAIPKKLLTAQEVAEILGVTLNWVYKLGRDGSLPSVRIGKLVRFDPKEVKEFIEKGGEP